MERLTLKRKDGSYTFKKSSALPFAIAKLGRLEDAEEQGLLLRLPCKKGSTVYKICEDKSAATIKSIEFEGHTYRRYVPHYFICISAFDLSMISKMGISVFLTKEEAEQTLADMKGE